MTKPTHKIASLNRKEIVVYVDNTGTNITCRPNYEAKPCFPQDEFDQIETCKLCKNTF